jgi:hypothetical protein
MCLIIEVSHQFLELAGRQTVEGVEGNAGAARLRD